MCRPKASASDSGQSTIGGTPLEEGRLSRTAAVGVNPVLDTMALVKCVVPSMTASIAAASKSGLSLSAASAARMPDKTSPVVGRLTAASTSCRRISTASVLVPPTSIPICTLHLPCTVSLSRWSRSSIAHGDGKRRYRDGLLGENSTRHRESNRVAAIGRAELSIEIAQMEPNGRHGQLQPARDDFVRHVLGEQVDHAPFLPCEPVLGGGLPGIEHEMLVGLDEGRDLCGRCH